MVRFEYITDDAVTQPGLIIDDVSIPEIGYSEDFENGAGDWVSEGWLLMDNVLPQDFVVQLVQTTNAAAPVTRWLSRGDAPQGEWEIMIGGEYGNARARRVRPCARDDPTGGIHAHRDSL